MFKLIKFALFLATVLIAGYFILGVTLGNKTLFEHLSGISKTDEAETLKSEIGKKIDGATHDLKEKAATMAFEELEEKARQEIGEEAEPSPAEPAAADRRGLDTLISRQNRAAEGEDRDALDQLIREKSAPR